MEINQNVEQIGERIRQLRRQQNLTQTELGADRYSKSYVSAVEKNTIRPSLAALQFFARRLDQRVDYFTSQPDLAKDHKSESETALSGSWQTADQSLQDEEFSLRYLLLQRAEPISMRVLKAFPTLAPEDMATFPAFKQSYYSLLAGLVAQEKQEHEVALQAFERALPLAPLPLRPTVLDALGQHYSLTHSYATALHYHLRALTALEHLGTSERENPLRFTVALHCGEDYRTLGNYAQACAMYEQARGWLRAEHEMKNAAQLYMGLGYCTYALVYQGAAQALKAQEFVLSGEMERGFQQAMGFVVQSRSIYQVSGDHLREAAARLLQTLALLDSITRYRQVVHGIGAAFAALSSSLLKDAEEHCRQVLISWQAILQQAEETASHEAIIYQALAYLVQIFISRATLARLRGQDSNALEERKLAAYLCQRMLDMLGETVFSWSLVQEILNIPNERSFLDSPPLPRVPEETIDSSAFRPRFTGQVEIYRAAAEVAEELGRTAASSEFQHDCYSQADRCFHTALTLASSIVAAGERDPGYMVRFHQRYAFLLEERMAASSEEQEETSSKLLALLKDGLTRLQAAAVLT